MVSLHSHQRLDGISRPDVDHAAKDDVELEDVVHSDVLVLSVESLSQTMKTLVWPGQTRSKIILKIS